MEPLIAIDLNSNINLEQLQEGLRKFFENFGSLDIVFLIDDDSIVELDGKLVQTFYNMNDLIESYKILKELSETKSNRLKVTSVIRLERELRRFPLIIITNRKIIGLEKNLVFVYDGHNVKMRY
ncbi:hypothetical protein BFU36_09515 [Sulfolobus sp. A20]|uniref:hypothetical protein n=1 Tax=Saccharolobus sp. A20 TaxID=1891280 RepID=UPI000845E35E|nr:hypothetical protein [Sulfolobus sp. A20]TRM78702.1 hypothetical protein DJ532_00075 [Sulfolobus sp. A20-N-F8]TRM81797.1 hypothetical protein DJ524_02790 [Sulfolobus sp. D5]TRM87887.1 hypothetical protein DJ529_06885 [Sulfolobus sp. C3]TRM95557.1 hypothetical protein DJ526_00270 [Sulfolobus sp. A20-N-G8]TRN02606.1 hypothetical protein DJ527_03430 [Sulfolobus sp. F1]